MADEFERESQRPDETDESSEVTSASRRGFLKVAVVSAAAAAAAVGTAGVAATALASNAPSGISRLLVLGNSEEHVSSSNPGACWTFCTDDSKTKTLKHNSKNDPFGDSCGAVYYWAWFTGLTSGQNYKLSLSAATPLPTWLKFDNSQFSNAVEVFPGRVLCPSNPPTGYPAESTKSLGSMTITGPSSNPHSFKTILVWLKLDANGAPKGKTLPLTLELKGTAPQTTYDQTASATAYFE